LHAVARSPITVSGEAVAGDPALALGVNVIDGKITYEAVAEAHNLEYTPLEDVLPLAPV
jgi:alanine dehydrogenase